MLRKVLVPLMVAFFATSRITSANNTRSVVVNPKGLIGGFQDLMEDAAGEMNTAANWLYDKSVGKLSSNSLTSHIPTEAVLAWQVLVEIDSASDANLAVCMAIYAVSGVNATKALSSPSQIDDKAWKHAKKGTKYLLTVAGDEIKDKLSTAMNYLGDLLDYNYAPFPFDVLTEKDTIDGVICIADSLFDYLVDAGKNIYKLAIQMNITIWNDLNFNTLFNTASLEREINETMFCLRDLGLDISLRQSDNYPDFAPLDEVYEWFAITEFTIGFSIDVTACTLTCGAVSIGFAVSTETGRFKPWYSVSTGVDTSSVVGVAVGYSFLVWPNFDGVAGYDTPATCHLVSMGIGLLSFIPSYVIGIDDFGAFAGIAFSKDILSFELGLNGAFDLSYDYAASYWITSTSDLKDAWKATETAITNMATITDEMQLILDALNLLTSHTLEEGAYMVSASAGNILTLSCPTEEDNAGNSSVVQLNWMSIAEVIYGNITGDNWCNSSVAYQSVFDECNYQSGCSINVTDSDLGNPACGDGVGYDLTVIYTCPGTTDVYDIGCFEASWNEVITKNWDQEYTHELLMDNWETRENAMGKCAYVAQQGGYAGFGQMGHGMCIAFEKLFRDGYYNQYPMTTDSTNCPSDGKGSNEAWNLYVFTYDEVAFEDLGCANLSEVEMINYKDMEGVHILSQDDYSTRQDTIAKCAHMALEDNYDGFALFDNGACYVSDDYKIDRFEALTGIETANGSSCGSGSGTEYALSVYSFPFTTCYANCGGGDDLDAGAIAGIAISLLLLILIGIFVAFAIWKYGCSKDGCGECTDDWCKCGICPCCASSPPTNKFPTKGGEGNNSVRVHGFSDGDQMETQTAVAIAVSGGPPPPPPQAVAGGAPAGLPAPGGFGAFAGLPAPGSENASPPPRPPPPRGASAAAAAAAAAATAHRIPPNSPGSEYQDEYGYEEEQEEQEEHVSESDEMYVAPQEDIPPSEHVTVAGSRPPPPPRSTHDTGAPAAYGEGQY